MDIQKAKEEIEKLEAAINTLIWNFEKQSGLTVENIDLRTVNHVGGRKNFIASDHIVNIDVKVNCK